MTTDKKTTKRARPHPASAGPKTSGALKRGQNSVSGDMAINIAMNSLNMLQDKFGQAAWVRAPGDEPAMFVLPKSLDVCTVCGQIILRTSKPLCPEHTPKQETTTNQSVPFGVHIDSVVYTGHSTETPKLGENVPQVTA